MQSMFYLLLPAMLFAPQLKAQTGCTDPLAVNYDAIAVQNDGSCQYNPTSYIPQLRCELENDLIEISGMVYGNGKWWGHNDSSFPEEFFALDADNGDVLQTIELKDAHNRDWEDMAADTQQLYIGDFGNNINNRQNLGVYLVPYTFIGNSNSETVQPFEWSFLPFSYNDQVDYSAQPEDNSVYDCEAMIVKDGQIHLFTKCRRDHNVTHYVINPSNNGAEKLETFNSEGVITGAALSPDGKLIILVGYDLRPFVPQVFCWLLWDWPANTTQFFGGNKRRIELGSSLVVGQVESVAFDGPRHCILSNERTSFNGITIVDESLWNMDLSAWAPATSGVTEQPEMQTQALAVPNPATGKVRMELPENRRPEALRLLHPNGAVAMAWQQDAAELDLGTLPAGLYLLEGAVEGRSVYCKVMKW